MWYGDGTQLLLQDSQQSVHSSNSELDLEQQQAGGAVAAAAAGEDFEVKVITLLEPDVVVLEEAPSTSSLALDRAPAAVPVNLSDYPCAPVTVISSSRARASSTTQSASQAPERHHPMEEEEVIIQPAKRGRKVSSVVWEHFIRNPKDKCTVQCKYCRQHVRLGREGKVGTTSMHRHLQLHRRFPHPKNLGLASPSPLPFLGIPSTPVAASSSAGAHATASQATTQFQETCDSKKTWHATDPRAMEHNQWLAEFIAKGMQPFSFVDDPSFRELMRRFVPQWKVPGRNYFACSAVPALGASIRAALLSSLKDCVGGSVHLTVDIWNSSQVQEYMSVTAHWIVRDSSTSSLVRHKGVLDMSGFGGVHTALNIAHKLNAVIDSWLPPRGITVAYVAADNAANIVQALQDSGVKHIPCIAHCLNLVVKGVLAKVSGEVQETLQTARAICSHFRHSAHAQSRLGEVQRQYNVPQHRLVLDVATQWTSTLHMAQRLCEQRRAITEYFEHTSNLQLTPRQWGLLKELIAALRPFEEALRLLTSDDSTLGQVLPLIRFVEKILMKLKQATQMGSPSCSLLADLLVQLRTSKPLKAMQADVVYWAASYLDPRFRDTFETYVGGLQGPVHRNLDEVKDYLQAEILEAYLKQARDGKGQPQGVTPAPANQPDCSSSSGLLHEEPSQPPPPFGSDSGDLWFALSDSLGLTATRASQDQHECTRSEGLAVAKRELDAYGSDDVGGFASPKSVPAKYWERKQHVWPALHTVAVRYLTCPPTSVYSERLFSTAGRISPSSRNNINLQCFIHMNQAWIPRDVPSDMRARLSSDVEEHCGQELAEVEPEEGEEGTPFFQRAHFEEEDCS